MKAIGSVLYFSELPESFQTMMLPLFTLLQAVDIIIAANGASAHDNYLFHLARLAGVKCRVLDLGPRLHPYEGVDVDAFLAPSQFVRQFPSVRKAASRLEGATVHVVRPGIDTSLFFAPSMSVPKKKDANATQRDHIGGGASEVRRSDARRTLPLLSSFLQKHDLPDGTSAVPGLANLVVGFIGRLSTEKSPGIFLRMFIPPLSPLIMYLPPPPHSVQSPHSPTPLLPRAKEILSKSNRYGNKTMPAAEPVSKNVKFVVVGDGELYTHLKQFARDSLHLELGSQLFNVQFEF